MKAVNPLRQKLRGQTAALGSVKALVRERFALGEADTVAVTEAAATLPGFPPRETVVSFFTDKGRHHFKVFKPAADVDADDLPPPWMKDALIIPEGAGCDCC
jgi:nitrate reductase delta subunit